MTKLDDFIGKWMKLKQAGKEPNLVLNTLERNTWANLFLGHGGLNLTHQVITVPGTLGLPC